MSSVALHKPAATAIDKQRYNFKDNVGVLPILWTICL